MYLRCFYKEAGRRQKKKKTKGNNTQAKVRQMWPAMRGLQLFIMKGIHCSVPPLPLSTQFFHTGPPSLLFAPSHVFVPLFFLLSSTFFYQFKFGVKQNLVCRQERAREGGIKIELWEGESGEGSRSAGQLGDQRGAMLVTSPSTHPVYWQGLMHTRAPTVPGHLRSSAGRVGEGGKHRRPQHLFSSQAICSVRPSLNVGLWTTHRHTYTNKALPYSLRGLVRAEARWLMRHNKHMHTCSLDSLVCLYATESQTAGYGYLKGYF